MTVALFPRLWLYSIIYRISAAGRGPALSRGDNMAEEIAETDNGAVEDLRAELANLKTRVNEFRENNLTLKKELEGYNGATPDEVAEALEIKRLREQQELVDSKDIGAALEKQKLDLTAEFDRRYSAVSAQNEELDRSLREIRVTSVLRTAAAEAGAAPEAIDDMLKTIVDQFESRDGELVRIVNGEAQLSKRSPGQTETPAEFFEELSISKPFYFSASGGGGGNETQRASTGKRRITREEMQSGRFAEDIRKGDVVVEGFDSLDEPGGLAA